MRALCLLPGCALVLCGVMGAQIRTAAAAPETKSTAAGSTDSPIITTLALNLCVDGSASYPCPNPITSDGRYIPSINLTYGQILDGVVVFGPPALNTGTITIYKDTDPVCVLVIGVDHECPPNSTIFDFGMYTLTATLTFPADSMYADSIAAPVAISIAKDTSSIALRSSASIASLGTAVTFTALVSGAYTAIPTGQVVFSMDGTTIPAVTLDATGTATYTTSTLELGMHTIMASYAGATDFLATTDVSIAQQIVPPATSTTIGSSVDPSTVGEDVTFTASVSTSADVAGTPTGKVTFKDGTASFATVQVMQKGTQNIAQATTSALAVGTHSITAIYSGDAATSASVSPVLIQQVNYPLTMAPTGYTLTVSPTPVSLVAGQTAKLTVTVTPVSGFADVVALSCSNLPNESACTFDEATIPSGGGSTTLRLSTMSPHDCGSDVPYGGFGASVHPTMPLFGRTLRYAGSALAGVLLFLLPRRRRRGIKGLLALALVCALASISGCGSRCTDFGTSPGGYTFKLDGSATSTTPVTTGTTPTSGGTATPNVSVSVALKVNL